MWAKPFPLVYIVILNYNGTQVTLNCVDSVLKIDYPNFKVLVVDNASTDGSVAVLRSALGDTLCSDHTQLLADFPLWLELSQVGQMMQLREKLASYRLAPNSAQRQSDPLHRRRFEISTLDIRYRALQRYPLPGDASRTSSVRAHFIRQIILRAAWVGNVTVARNQLRRLRGIGEKVGWKEIACVALAFIPLPRRSLRVAYMKIAPHYLERMGVNLIKYFLGPAVFPPCDKE